MNRQRFLGWAVLTVLVAAGGCERSQSRDRSAAGHNDAPGAASTAQVLPDWSGAWAIDFKGSGNPLEVLQKSLRPAVFAEIGSFYQKYFDGGEGNFRELYCHGYMFSGFSGEVEGFEGLIEFLFSPGRVTLIWEGGLVRRIYTDGRALPEDPEPTTAVSSAGRWDHQTLLVETRLNPNAAPLYSGRGLPVPGGQVGKGARLSERIFLKDPDTLQVDEVLDAPAAFTQPARLTLLFQRVPGYYMSDYTGCPSSDRALDARTGRARIDMTPPTDLPPPPKE